MVNVLGEGGRDVYGKYTVNAMQLLRGLYNVFNYIEVDIIKAS